MLGVSIILSFNQNEKLHTKDVVLWLDESPASTRVREGTLLSPVYTVNSSTKQIEFVSQKLFFL